MIRLIRRSRACLPVVHYTYVRTSALKVRHAGEICPQIERDVASYRTGRPSLGHNGSRTTSEGANGVSIARGPKRLPCSLGLHPLLGARSLPSAGWKAARVQINGVHSAGERPLSFLNAWGPIMRPDTGTIPGGGIPPCGHEPDRLATLSGTAGHSCQHALACKAALHLGQESSIPHADVEKHPSSSAWGSLLRPLKGVSRGDDPAPERRDLSRQGQVLPRV